MTERLADLHIHTSYSDSTLTPQEVVEEANACGLSCIAITDHDTIQGLQPTIAAAQKYGLEVLPGVELSAEINGREVHILGYLFNPNDQAFVNQLQHMQNFRIERMQTMLDKLKEFGINNIRLEEVCALADSNSVGRPHLAAVLKEKGWVANLKEAFNKYLAEGAPAYVPKYEQTPQEAIHLIRRAGGVAVLAHPMLTQIDELIPRLVKEGLGGLEVYYPNASETAVRFYEGLARKHHLVMTGGSDAHGTAKSYTFIGKLKIPYKLVEELKAR